MALVTVQRSPSPNTSAEGEDGDVPDASESSIKSPRQRSFSESYFTVKGAALILPQSDYEAAYNRKPTKHHGGDEIQGHLQAMFSLLRPQDTIKVAVKLEGKSDESQLRYLAVVSCIGRQDTEESVILGINITDKAHIGLIIPIWAHTRLRLDGDGGFHIDALHNIHCFKPVSVQAMWSALQSLNKVVKIATDNLYLPRGLTHTWVGYYESKLTTNATVIGEWNQTQDIDNSYRDISTTIKNADEETLYKTIKTELKKVMMSVDLEEVTCLFLRKAVEEKMGMDLKEHRSFIDKEMMAILGQMDAPSKILDYLYLGSEWNASNLEELQQNGVNHILNISREIDNFFPGILHYYNVREWDIEDTNLQKHWEDTYRFIIKARKKGSKTLVHCKMGISRSASTVIAFLMKEQRWSLQEAFEYCKSKRSIINPNSGFWKQLKEYEGILTARRHGEKFNSSSSQPLLTTSPEEKEEAGGSAQNFTPEECLSLKLGPGSEPGEGFMHTEQDIEIASRSADSTEDSVPDNLSPEPEKPRKSHRRKLAKSASESGDISVLSSDSSDFTDSEDLTDSEDDEDYEHEYNFIDHTQGFKPIDVPSIDITSDDDKKKKPKKKDTKRSKSESDKASASVDDGMTLKLEENKGPAFSREGSQTRYKPDDHWIKPEQEEETEETAEKLETDIAEVDENKGIDTGQSNSVVEIESKENAECAKSKIDGPEDMDTTDDVDKTITEQSTEQKSLMKDLDPYKRENIPWNPGTVKKQKDDIEEKFGAVSDKKNKPEDLVDVQQKAFTEEIVGKSPPATQPVIKVDIANENEEPMSCDSSDKAEDSPMDTCEGQSQVENAKASVYAREEIDLPEGIVRKTTQEIEKRNIILDSTPKKKITRSSSLKTLRVTPKARDRDNERRKTCIAILSPTNQADGDRVLFDLDTDFETEQSGVEPTDVTLQDLNAAEALSADAGKASSDQEEEGISTSAATVKVYKYMGEELTVQEGMVRKQKMDIEQHAFKQGTTPMDDPVPVEHSSAIIPVSSDTPVNTKQASPSSAISMFTHQTDKAPHDSDKERDVKGDESDSGSVDSAHIEKVDVIKTKLCEKGGDSHVEQGTCSSAQHLGRRQKQESRFDRETLELIREIGSALLNSPAKANIETDDDDNPPQGKGLVNHFVRKIENASGIHKKKARKEIIVIDKDSVSPAVPKNKTLEQGHVLYVMPRTSSVETAERSKSRSQVDPVQKRNSFSKSHENCPVSSPVEIVSANAKWSPVSRTSEGRKEKVSPSMLDEKGRSEFSEMNLGLESHHGESASDSGNTSSQEEVCSVKNLRGKFEYSEPQSSGKSTPVFGMSNLSSPSSNTHIIPGAKVDSETTEWERPCPTVVAGEASGPFTQYHTTPTHQQRQSEPVIKLSDKNLLLLHKTLGDIISKKQLQGALPEESVISEGASSDRDTVRPKSAGQGQIRGRRSDTIGSHPSPALASSQLGTEDEQKDRKPYGRTHPLAKLENQNFMDKIRSNPFYNTM